mmetsp:Transcript_21158/g.55077  ORF Transcript_21158/g.55077 Transcript_21158/m.55077 type:complete len:371 (+) Transcript_21158:68-1180(+)
MCTASPCLDTLATLPWNRPFPPPRPSSRAATLGPISLTAPGGPASMNMPLPSVPHVRSTSTWPIRSPAAASVAFIHSMSPASRCAATTIVLPPPASATSRSAVASASSRPRALARFSESRAFLQMSLTCSKWRSGAAASAAVRACCRVNMSPASARRRSPTTKCSRVVFLTFSARSSLMAARWAVVWTWVPQHRFWSTPSIVSTRTSPTTSSGKSFPFRTVAISGLLGPIHVGPTACPARTRSLTAASSAVSISSVKGCPSVPRSSDEVSPTPRHHPTVGKPSVPAAVAVIKCCPVCCCMWSHRRAQSTTTSTSDPTSSGATVVCSGKPPTTCTSTTAVPPTVPRSNGWPPPSGKSTVSVNRTCHSSSGC